jgi:hypothetical protein
MILHAPTATAEPAMTVPSDHAPMLKMLAIFLTMQITAGVVLFGYVQVMPDAKTPSWLGMVFLMLGAVTAGQTGARNTGRRLTAGEKASFALAATVTSIALSVALLWGLLAWFGVPFSLENVVLAITGDTVPYAEIMEFLPWIGLFVVTLDLVLCFFAVGWGARTLLKQQERLAAKGK